MLFINNKHSVRTKRALAFYTMLKLPFCGFWCFWYANTITLSLCFFLMYTLLLSSHVLNIHEPEVSSKYYFICTWHLVYLLILRYSHVFQGRRVFCRLRCFQYIVFYGCRRSLLPMGSHLK